MRFVALLAALAATLVAVPAAAQQQQPAQAAEPFAVDRVSADITKSSTAAQAADPENTWVLDLSTGGRVTVRLRPDVAPKMVERIKTLTRQGFYNGVVFHRVINEPYFIAQSGDPKGDGTGGSDLPDLEAEFNNLPHVRGAVSAARMGAREGASPEEVKKAENSANSQFFIMLAPRLTFDGSYTVFGRVTSGMEFVDKIQRGEPPANPTRILNAYVAADNPPAFVAPAPETRVLPAGESAVTLPGTAPQQ